MVRPPIAVLLATLLFVSWFTHRGYTIHGIALGMPAWQVAVLHPSDCEVEYRSGRVDRVVGDQLEYNGSVLLTASEASTTLPTTFGPDPATPTPQPSAKSIRTRAFI